MKATGIVRRIDDLGRVVIPKEIRRTMRIREGDPLEIYTDREGEVIFKKYSPIGELSAFASEYADTLRQTSGLPILVTDRDAVIAVAGASKKEYLDKRISPDVEKIMEERGLSKPQETFSAVLAEGGELGVRYAMPILARGDLVGCILTAAPAEFETNLLADVEGKLIQTAGIFLGKQMEN